MRDHRFEHVGTAVVRFFRLKIKSPEIFLESKGKIILKKIISGATSDRHLLSNTRIAANDKCVRFIFVGYTATGAGLRA